MSISTVLRVAVVPLAVVVGIVLLWRADSVPFARALQLVLAFVLLVDLATLLKGRLQNTCVVLASLAVGLAIVEGVAEARLPHVKETNDKALWGKNTELGYSASKAGVFPAKKVVDGRVAFDVSYTIDDKLRRQTISDAHGPKVRFFGDSYTFGVGLNDAETLPQTFARMSGANVLNFAYSGYGPAQSLRMLELGLHDEDLKDAKLIVLQTGAFHIERVACLPWYTRGFPRYADTNGKLELNGHCEPAERPMSSSYKLLVEPETRQVGHADVELYLKVVSRFIELARSKYHAEVLILDMALDPAYLKGTGVSPAAFENRLRAAGAMVLDVGSIAARPDLVIPNDGHTTGKANQLMAAEAIAFLSKTKPDLGIRQVSSLAESKGN